MRYDKRQKGVPSMNQLTANIAQSLDTQKLGQEYRTLWLWSAQAIQRLDDDEDDSAQQKYTRLIELEDMLLQELTNEELVAIRE